MSRSYCGIAYPVKTTQTKEISYLGRFIGKEKKKNTRKIYIKKCAFSSFCKLYL